MKTQCPILISKIAYNEILKIIFDKKIPSNYGLRIGLKGGGCGATYILGFDEKASTDDEFIYKNIKIFIEKKHLMYLFDIEIDFEAKDKGMGFTFNQSITTEK